MIHRWSFNGSLEDSVGNADAFTVDGSGVTVENGRATTSPVVGGLQLGNTAGLLGTGSATIEIWGKPDEEANQARAWARIFEYGWQPAQNYLLSMMWWSDTSNSFRDSITFNYPVKGFGNSVGNLAGSAGAGSPYSTTNINYLCATFKADGSGNTEIVCRRYDPGAGAFVTRSYTIGGWTLADMNAAELFLGRANWNGEVTVFKATYDEVRIYDSALPEGLLAINAAMGADVTAFTCRSDGKIDFNIPANCTLPVNARTLGADYSTGGAVTLAAGARIEFNPANCGACMKFTAEGGFTGPSGAITAETLSQFVALTDTANYMIEMSGDGKTIEVKLYPNVAANAYWTGGGAAGAMDDPANWKCVNAAGDTIDNGLPAGATAVWAREGDGATSFSIPSGCTPDWARFNVGGNVSLSAACDWSAIPVVKLADGATLDLNGNNLKATCIEAASGTASVVNTAAGAKPLLWRENATHETALVGSGVSVDTENVEVKLVNSVDLAFEANIASSLDATFEQNSGAVTATANTLSIGYGAGRAGCYTLNDGTFVSNGSLVLGWGGAGTFRQTGGSVPAIRHLNIGVDGGTGTYLMEDGTLFIVSRLLLGAFSGGSGMFRQTGGAVTDVGLCFVGNDSGSGGRYIMEGGSLAVTQQALRIGRNSPGELSVSNGTVTVTYQTWVGDGATGSGTLRVLAGGTLTTAYISPNESGANMVEFAGGTVRANSYTGSFPFLNNLTNIAVRAQGMTIDTAGYSIGATNCTFLLDEGAVIAVAGNGTFDLSAARIEAPYLAGCTNSEVVVAAADTARISGTPDDSALPYGWYFENSNGGILKAVRRPLVANVRGAQRTGSQLVDIYYDLDSTGGTYSVEIAIEGVSNRIAAVSFTGDAGAGVAPGKDRHIVWDAGADWPDQRGDVRFVVRAVKQSKVQLWEDGPYWATTNIGAEKPEDYGWDFWWGDTVGYKYENGAWVASDGSSSYSPFSSGNTPTYGKSISELQSAGYIDSTGNLVAAHDAATAHLGAPWRMPTDAEFRALLANCTTTWTTRNGVSGCLFTGKGDYSGKSIFLPAADFDFVDFDSGLVVSVGRYWSSTPHSGTGSAWGLYLSPGTSCWFNDSRSYGQSVRPVTDSADSPSVVSVASSGWYWWFEVSEAQNGSISAPEAGWKPDGDEFILEAVPAEHYHFVEWTGDTEGCTVTNGTGLSVAMDRPRTVGATFAIDAFTVVFEAGAHGTLTGETSQTLNYAESAVAPAVAPDAGYEFTGWSGDVSAPITGDVTFTAQYAVIPYSITYTGLNGASNTNPETYTVEDEIVFAVPGEVYGWVFKGWTPASIALGSTGAVEVAATWERRKFNVTVNGETKQYDYEKEVTFPTPKPFETNGMQVVTLGTTFTDPVVTNEFTIAVTNDIEFAWDILATNWWFATAETENGSISAPEAGWKPDGDEFILEAVPAEHYHFVEWTGDTEGCTVTNGTGLSVAMDRPRTIGATFAIDAFTVVFKAGAHGALTGETSQTLDYGESAVAPDVAPDAGYEFTGWSGDTSAPVTSDVTFTAQYAVIPYSITYTGLNGASNTNPETYTVEDEIVFAAPGEVYGWVFKGWTPASIALGSTGVVEVAAIWERRKFNVTVNGETKQYDYEEEATFTAEPFETNGMQVVTLGTTFTDPVVTNEVTVMVTNDIEFAWDILATNWWFATAETENGSISAPEAGWKPDGDEFILEAVPAEHYHFVEWTGDTEGCTVTNGTGLSVAMDRPRTIGATFANAFTVVFEAGAHGALIGETSQTLDYGESAVAPAVAPDAGYEFTGWSGDVSAPITGDVTFTAQYAVIPYSITYAGLNGASNTNPETYTVEDEIVFAVPGEVYGWVFKGWTPASIALGSTGVVEVAATWERRKFNVTVNGETKQYDYEKEVPFPAPEPFETNGMQIVTLGTTFTDPVVTNEFTVVVTNDIEFAWDILATNWWFEVSEAQNGSITAPEVGWKPDGDEFILEAVPVDHYHFVEWTGDTEGCTVTNGTGLSVAMDGPRTVGATFAIDAFTVVFEAGAHGALTGETSQTLDYGESVVAPAVAPNAGYEFTGWSGDVSAPITGDVTFTAQYAAIPYAITYTGLNGASNTNPETYTVEDEIVFAVPGEVYGWVFKGWTPASIALGSTGAVEVAATWERRKFNVTVNGETKQYDYEKEATFSAKPFETNGMQIVTLGTTFTDPVVTNEVTVTVTNDIEFAWDILATNWWFATAETENGSITAPEVGWKPDGDEFILEAVPVEHYHFVEWTGDTEGCTVTNGTGLSVAMDCPRTVGATFAIDEFTVTFEAGAHGALTGETSQTLGYGESAVAPDVAPNAGYEFTGWSGDTSAPVTNNVTFTAQYAVVSYAITYTDLKGASNQNPAVYTVEDEIVFTAPGEVYGWIFKGWTPASITAGSTGTVEVTANWERQKFDVTVNGETKQYGYEEEVSLATNAAINCGATQYVCKGWTAANAEPESGDGANAEFKVLGDVSFAWLWETNEVALAQAVNAEGLDWATGGAAEWLPEWSEEAADGLHQAYCEAIPNGTNAWIATTVEGPGTIAFKWSSALASRNTKFQFMVDGEVKGMLSGTNGWTETSVTVSGFWEHEIKWRLTSGRSGAAAGDRAALDCVAWTPSVPPTLAEALNTNLVWTTDGDAAWHGVAWQSPADARDAWAEVAGLGDLGTAAVQTRVYGSGVLSFDWAVSCEEDYDWLELSVDGVVRDVISGECGWSSGNVEIAGDGWHVVRWEFLKDEMDDPELAGANVAKLDNVEWKSGDTPPATEQTQTTPVPVPYAVLESEHFAPYLEQAGGDYEKAAHTNGLNGCAIWKSYVAGLEPDDANSKFTAKIEMLPDGTPKVTWEPDTPELRATRTYIRYGKIRLEDEEWTPIADDADASILRQYHFFTVEVKMK